jgi:hypothetical protein
MGKTESGLTKQKFSKINDILENVYYGADYDYTRTQCNGGCIDYCRCTSVVGARVKNIDVEDIVNRIQKLFSTESEITKYCIDRVLRHSELTKIDLWKVNITGGYYGEEVDGVRFTCSHDIINLLSELFDKPEHERINYILTNEYGYLLPDAEDRKWKIETALTSNIMVNNKSHYIRLNKDIIEKYERIIEKDKNYIICICLKNGDNFRLIDGYHRFAASSEKQIRIISGE